MRVSLSIRPHDPQLRKWTFYCRCGYPGRVEEHSARNGDPLVEGDAQVRARPALTGRDGRGRMSEEEARQLANDISAALLALEDIPENDTAGRDVIEDALTLLRALRSYDKAVSNPER